MFIDVWATWCALMKFFLKKLEEASSKKKSLINTGSK
jgi:hypothetical protein